MRVGLRCDGRGLDAGCIEALAGAGLTDLHLPLYGASRAVHDYHDGAGRFDAISAAISAARALGVTVVVTTPAVNDALVLGDEEPQTKWDNYFVGDGFTSKFRLRHQMFRGASTDLLSDDWTETSFSTDLWTIQDPQGVFSLIGSLNVNQKGVSGNLNETYILGKNGVELGGMLNLQHGEFQFVDTCQGIVGGIYLNTTLTQANCVAGFQLSPSGTIVVTASGAGGVIIQPLMNGVRVGPTVVSKPNHHYQLQTWIGGDNWARYQAAYRTLTGQVQYGGRLLQSNADVTFVITDIDLGAFTAVTGGFVPNQIPTQNADGSFTYIIPAPPVVTKYTVSNAPLPSFGVYAPINGQNLNLTLSYTLLAQPPQGALEAQAPLPSPRRGEGGPTGRLRGQIAIYEG